MDKNKFFTVVVTIGISAIILFGIIHFIFGNNKIDQGNFRISDTVLSSIVELEDKSKGTSQWKYDISQNNKISMLIQTVGDATVKEIYLENFKIKSKNKVHIYVEQDSYDVSMKYEDIRNKKINIYTEETESGDYLVEFDIRNEDLVANYTIPEGIKEIRHDGTILNTVNIPISDIRFQVKYNLVVVQDNKKVNKCKVEMQMPDDKLLKDGFFVQRLDISNYTFKVNY